MGGHKNTERPALAEDTIVIMNSWQKLFALTCTSDRPRGWSFVDARGPVLLPEFAPRGQEVVRCSFPFAHRRVSYCNTRRPLVV